MSAKQAQSAQARSSRALAAMRSIKPARKTRPAASVREVKSPAPDASVKAASEASALRAVARLARSNGWAGAAAGMSLQAFLAEQLAKAALVDAAGPGGREHIQRSINAVQALREMNRVTAPLEGPSFLDQIRPPAPKLRKR